MSQEFEESVIKRLDNLDNKMNEIKIKLLILNKSNELIYKINKKNEEKIKSIDRILSKNSIQIAHLYETVRNHEERLRKLIS